MSTCKGLSLLSGGLDSQLAVKVLQDAGAYVEGVVFETPFFSVQESRKAASALGVVLHVVDFTEDEVSLIENPAHGFGSAMNPCIDCHALMIKRAGELMREKGFDFVATGEVAGQRPMSQNRQALQVVAKTSGLEGRLVRPLSAQLLEPTIPEQEGILDRSKLLNISGRKRDRQIELAAHYNLVEYPSPAGGCKLTEEGFCRKLKDLQVHEGLKNRELLNLINVGRRFRLPSGAGIILGRDAADNNVLMKKASHLGFILDPRGASGPTALLVGSNANDGDIELAAKIVRSYSKAAGGMNVLIRNPISGEERIITVEETDRKIAKEYQIC
jgi:tRNA U34 2-thiouridine synthase MnmA/TrmU